MCGLPYSTAKIWRPISKNRFVLVYLLAVQFLSNYSSTLHDSEYCFAAHQYAQLFDGQRSPFSVSSTHDMLCLWILGFVQMQAVRDAIL